MIRLQAASMNKPSVSPKPESPSPEKQSTETPNSPPSPKNEATVGGGEAVSMNRQPPPAWRGVSAQAAPALPAGGLRRTPERMLSRSGATLSALPNTLSSA